MIIKVQVFAWRCTACGYTWIPKKDEVKQLRCMNKKCRKLANFVGIVKETK